MIIYYCFHYCYILCLWLLFIVLVLLYSFSTYYLFYNISSTYPVKPSNIQWLTNTPSKKHFPMTWLTVYKYEHIKYGSGLGLPETPYSGILRPWLAHPHFVENHLTGQASDNLMMFHQLDPCFPMQRCQYGAFRSSSHGGTPSHHPFRTMGSSLKRLGVPPMTSHDELETYISQSFLVGRTRS